MIIISVCCSCWRNRGVIDSAERARAFVTISENVRATKEISYTLQSRIPGQLATFYSFFNSPCLPAIVEVEKTSIAVNADDVR